MRALCRATRATRSPASSVTAVRTWCGSPRTAGRLSWAWQPAARWWSPRVGSRRKIEGRDQSVQAALRRGRPCRLAAAEQPGAARAGRLPRIGGRGVDQNRRSRSQNCLDLASHAPGLTGVRSLALNQINEVESGQVIVASRSVGKDRWSRMTFPGQPADGSTSTRPRSRERQPKTRPKPTF